MRPKIAGSLNGLVCLVFWVIAAFDLLPATVDAGERGVRITAIEVEGLSSIKEEELIDMICFHPGDIFDTEGLRRGIKRAFKKGIFLDIKAVAETHEGGLKLQYIVEEIPIVRRINVKGNKLVSEKEIRKAFLFKEGELFREGYAVKARAGLAEFYSRKGFPEAGVRINAGKDGSRNNVALHLLIEEGRPLIVESIEVPPEARRLVRVSTGDIFDRDRVEEDIERLKKHYRKQKHNKPSVGPYQFENGKLVIPVVPGPRLDVVFRGNRVFSAKELMKEVSLLEGEDIAGEVLQEIAGNIVSLYRKKGYYYAQAAGGIETHGDVIRVVFYIFEGERVLLRKIEFEGTEIPGDVIRAVIPVRENKPFDESLLSAGTESITQFFRALGYLYAEVGEVKKDFYKDGTEVHLVFVINAGPQVKISDLTVYGNRSFDDSEILNVLKITGGDPYNEKDILDARYRLLSFYGRNGYINANIEIERVIDRETAFLIFRITENKPSVFGKVIIRGNLKTKDIVIRREIDMEEGEPYNYDAVLRARRSLYRLGLFTDISIETLNPPVPESHTDGDSGPLVQDVLVELKEGNPGVVEMGLGYGDYESLRGFFDISYNNLGGYNRRIGLRTELSSVKKRVALNFKEPRLFNRPSLPLTVYLIKEDIRSVNLDTKDVMYKVDRLSFLAGIDREFSEHLSGSLNYEYSFVKTTDIGPGVVLSKEDTGVLGISSVSSSLFYDTSDNPFDPTSGSLNGFTLKFASRYIFSETDFIKAVFQSSWYFQIRNGLILALSMKGGAAQGFGDTSELPIIERFFLGGRTTVRGYTQDTLGPKGEGDNPTGGNVFFLANAELRAALGKGFGIVTFVDGGNVWERSNNVDSQLRYTVGAGLRYNTAVGPIRIDYGHKLDREEGESSGEIHFSLGHAF